MRIERIKLRLIEIPLTYQFETSFGGVETRKAIIVEMESEGIIGYGECASLEGPWYSYETIGIDWEILCEYMIPALLGKEIEDPSHLCNLLDRIRGYNMAKASLEGAFWDLFAKGKKISLAKALGGIRDRVQVGVSIGIQKDIPTLLEMIKSYLDQGYPRIKVKIKHGWDTNVIEAIRKKFPRIPLSVDANAAYTLEDLEVFRKLDEFNLLMIEQPLAFNDLIDHAELQGKIKTPICLDESIDSFTRAREAIRLGSCGIINIKPPRVGGLCESKRIHDFCMENEIPVWCGGMLETGIGAAHCVAIASLPNFKLPGDISVYGLYSAERIIEPVFKLSPDGTLNVPDGPGIGVSVIEDEIERLTIKVKNFR